MKGLKETLALQWTRKIEALHFLTVLAHGIARIFVSFMVFGMSNFITSFTEGPMCQPIAKLDNLDYSTDPFSKEQAQTTPPVRS